MGLETATYINQLDATNPLGSDQKSQGDDHLRLIKSTIKNTFPNFGAAALAASNTQLDKVVSSISINASAPAASVTIDASGNGGIGGAPTLYNGIGRGEFDIQGSSSAILGFGTAGTPRGYISATPGGMEIGGPGTLNLVTGNAVRATVATTGKITQTTTAGDAFVVNTSDVNGPYQTYQTSGTSIGFVGSAAQLVAGGAASDFAIRTVNNLSIGAGTGTAIYVNASNVAQYGGFEIGWRDIPYLAIKTGAYSPVVADRGKMIPLGSGAALTIPASVFNAGATFSLINASGGVLTVAQGAGLTLYLAGTTSSGTRTLQANAIATVHFYTGTTALISGPGVS